MSAVRDGTNLPKLMSVINLQKSENLMLIIYDALVNRDKSTIKMLLRNCEMPEFAKNVIIRRMLRWGNFQNYFHATKIWRGDYSKILLYSQSKSTQEILTDFQVDNFITLLYDSIDLPEEVLEDAIYCTFEDKQYSPEIINDLIGPCFSSFQEFAKNKPRLANIYDSMMVVFLRTNNIAAVPYMYRLDVSWWQTRAFQWSVNNQIYKVYFAAAEYYMFKTRRDFTPKQIVTHAPIDPAEYDDYFAQFTIQNPDEMLREACIQGHDILPRLNIKYNPLKCLKAWAQHMCNDNMKKAKNNFLTNLLQQINPLDIDIKLIIYRASKMDTPHCLEEIRSIILLPEINYFSGFNHMTAANFAYLGRFKSYSIDELTEYLSLPVQIFDRLGRLLLPIQRTAVLNNITGSVTFDEFINIILLYQLGDLPIGDINVQKFKPHLMSFMPEEYAFIAPRISYVLSMAPTNINNQLILDISELAFELGLFQDMDTWLIVWRQPEIMNQLSQGLWTVANSQHLCFIHFKPRPCLFCPGLPSNPN